MIAKKMVLLILVAGMVSGQELVKGLEYRAFADIQFRMADEEATGPGFDGFKLGQFDHVITGHMTDDITFMGETVFEYDAGWLMDVERLWIEYELADYLKLGAGKFHTFLGYWNHQYHHGAVIQTPISRPDYLLFEDEGGILPIHNLGVMLSGSGMGEMNFGYALALGNGIGSDPVSDNDHWKSLNAFIHFSLFENTDVGLGGYFDKAYQGFDGTPVLFPFFETIGSGDVVYHGESLELIAEYALVMNSGVGSGSGSNTVTHGIYGLGSYQIGKFRPYFKSDYLFIPEGDPYFTAAEIRHMALGVRLDLNFNVAMKFEYNWLDRDDFISNAFHAQWCVGI